MESCKEVILASKRSCGDCIACCVYLKIPQINKKACEHCKYLSLDHPARPNEMQLTGGLPHSNCKIYGSSKRPESCSGYSCLWLLGHGKEEDRPDRSLIIADTTHKIGGAIEIKQLKEGAADTPEGMETIIRMSKSTKKVALVASFYEVRLERVIGRHVV